MPILENYKGAQHHILLRIGDQVLTRNYINGKPVRWSMPLEEQIDSETIQRLKRQGDFLLKMYQAEFAKNPTSHAAESARSNMIALRHTIEQIHGR